MMPRADARCVSEEVLARWLESTLSDDDRAATAAHVETCDECRELTSTLLRLEPDPGVTGDEQHEVTSWHPHPALKVAHYVLLECVGRGAMGEIFAAWDTRLERRVAIKWVRGPTTPDAERRLWVEAQTLARLAHPNVVRVLDVGSYLGRNYLVMEWVAGCTLRQYLLTPSSWRHRLALLVPAGRGLAAAHRAGIIHRDVKPDNVLVGDDGLARMSDFGLATVPTGERVIAGTLTYMAPEQLRGEVDPRADQFSFALVAWQTLVGTLPIDATTYDDKVAALRAFSSKSARGALPAPLMHVLVRALALRPEARFASVDVLTDELARALERPRRRALFVTAALVALVAGFLGSGWVEAHRCDGAGAAWQVLVTPERGHFITHEGSAVRPLLERYAESWRTSYTTICEATKRHHTQPAVRLEQRLACLEKQRAVVGLMLDEAGRDTPLDAGALSEAFNELVPARDCERIEPTSTSTMALGENALLIERINVAVQLGQRERAEELVMLLSSREAVLRQEGLLADFLLARSTAREPEGLEEAKALEVLRERALAEALREGDDEVAFNALLSLADTASLDRGDFDEAMRRYAEAEAYLSRLGHSSHFEALLLRSRGLSLLTANHTDAAERDADRLLALGRGLSPSNDELVLSGLEIKVGVLYVRRDFEGAAPLADRMVELATKQHGVTHLTTLDDRATRARLLAIRGYSDAAIAEFEAIAELQRGNAADTASLGLTLLTISSAEADRRNLTRSIAVGREALALLTGAAFEQYIGEAEVNLARSLRLAGRFDEAGTLARSAVQHGQAHFGPVHREIANALRELARAQLGTGAWAEAHSNLNKAREIDVASTGEDSVTVAVNERLLAELEGLQGQPVHALALLDVAQARLERIHASRFEFAEVAAERCPQLNALKRHQEAADWAAFALDQLIAETLPRTLVELAKAQAALRDAGAAHATIARARALLADPCPAHAALARRLLALEATLPRAPRVSGAP